MRKVGTVLAAVVALLLATPAASQATPEFLTAAKTPEIDLSIPERPDPNPQKATSATPTPIPAETAWSFVTTSPPPQRLHAAGAGGATLFDPASIEPYLDGYVANAMADQYPPGMMVAVATRDRIFVKAYGLADAAQNIRATDATLFRIASISKTFVWTAVMMLVDEGKLDLDADVETYLKTVKVGPRGMPPITMRDLMAHRPGFEDTLGDFFQAKSGRTVEEALARTRPARVAPPGERTSYSNWGTGLAAQIVADVTGMPFDVFVVSRLLRPIGMVSTIQHDPKAISGKTLNDAALEARLAAPHKLDAGAPEVMTHNALEPLHAAGGIALDARDGARWVQFLLKGGVAGDTRLLSPEAFARMRTRAFRDRPFAPDFAHGFMETEIAGAITFGHGGTLSGFLSDMTIAPSLGVGVLVAVNGVESPRLPDLVSRYIIEQFARAHSYPSAWPVIATPEMIAKAKSAAGSYLPNRRVWSRLEKVSAIGSEITLAAKDDGSLVVSAGGEASRFFPLADDLWSDRSRDRLYVYRDASGAPVRISVGMGTMTAERVSFLTSSGVFNAAIGLVAFASLMAFVGAWRRQGREVETTDLGVWLARGHAGAAFLWLLFIVVLSAVSASLTGKDLPALQAGGWPPVSMIAAIVVAHLTALAAVAAAVGVFPVLVGSGWSLWRKAHYAAFAAAGLLAVWQMAVWKLILAAPSV